MELDPETMIVIVVVIGVLFVVVWCRDEIKKVSDDTECRNFHNELDTLRRQGKIK